MTEDKRWFYHLTAGANEQRISNFYTSAVTLCMFLSEHNTSKHIFKSSSYHFGIFLMFLFAHCSSAAPPHVNFENEYSK